MKETNVTLEREKLIERNVIKQVDKDECDKNELIEQGDKKVDRDDLI